jgi:hypothetical protein
MRFYMKRKLFFAGLFPVLLFACSRMPSRVSCSTGTKRAGSGLAGKRHRRLEYRQD